MTRPRRTQHRTRRAFLGAALRSAALAALPPALAPLAPAAQAATRPFADCAGFAYAAHPAIPHEQMLAEAVALRDLGVNTIYIAHANPARSVNQATEEVGLCFALYDALQGGDPAARDLAQWSIEAVHRLLRVTAEAGMQAVLPVGYQIQMGDAWSDRNPGAIRRRASGAPLNHWGGPGARTASPYAAQYQADIAAYYAWVGREFIARYPHIAAVNLADEPMGADFSEPARQAFAQRHGKQWAEAGRGERGAFLSRMLADYARWSAEAFSAAVPQVELATMMTFHVERQSPWYPDFEAIFAEAPPHFVFSADTHLNDSAADGVTEDDLLLLPLMCRTLGWLARVYGRRLMLWTSANAWGLSSRSSLEDARRNLELVLGETRRGGGQIAMLMAWGKHIAGQDLPQQAEVERSVARWLGEARPTLSAPPDGQPPDVILAYDAGAVARAAAATGADHLLPLRSIVKARTIRERLAALKQSPARTLRDERSVILKRPGRAFDEALAQNPAARVIALF